MYIHGSTYSLLFLCGSVYPDRAPAGVAGVHLDWAAAHALNQNQLIH